MVKRKIKKIVLNLIKSNKPDFLIIGAQKAGTTSLHYYLHQHPLLIGAEEKEVSFFSSDYNFEKGNKWYHNKFKDIRRPFPHRDTLFFESTPEYIYNNFALERIYKYNPRLKLIIILRDPVSRAYSAWNMFRDFTTRPNGIPKSLYKNYIKYVDNNLYKELYSLSKFPDFNKVIDDELKKINTNSTLLEPSFIRRGIYVKQLEKIYDLFNKDQVLIIDFNQLIKNKFEVLNQVTTFLNVDKFDWNINLESKEYNKRPYKSKIDNTIEKKLKLFYKPHNERLYKLINQKFDWE